MGLLVLNHNGTFVRHVSKGSWFELPDGRRVSPAYAGWQSGDGYALAPYVAPVPPAPTPEQLRAEQIEAVKAEAMRRILVICPEWKQRNLTAQAAILAEKGRANWTTDELAAWNAGKAIWDRIAAVRMRSDAIEALDPIPADFTDDQHWG
ncbi:hypothetical protein [Aquibium sp. ELW1220]|uniref:hypothetical protein n=1 Tax=Aquibium sp. ELW1220 TaxID=2976766 RepID=UPI0025AFAF4D|nr:hypothetical protein [Aquibium sp. ELW1220]MDN2584078.1 hypothetical protein [Aquibium sp. ELW1220]